MRSSHYGEPLLDHAHMSIRGARTALDCKPELSPVSGRSANPVSYSMPKHAHTSVPRISIPGSPTPAHALAGGRRSMRKGTGMAKDSATNARQNALREANLEREREPGETVYSMHLRAQDRTREMFHEVFHNREPRGG